MPVLVTRRVRTTVAAGLLLAAWPLLAWQTPSPPKDLDRFMERVLQKRDENWKKLHDYILSETERFDVTGPGGARLEGARREYSWFVRDGYLVRSPVRFDGVTIGEAERRAYETKWLADEKAREERRSRREAAGAGRQGAGTEAAGQAAPAQEPDNPDAIIDRRFEPRFVSEAYFLRFRFEAGNYYLVGRERLDNHDVLRIEYYPTALFGGRGRGRGGQAPAAPASGTQARGGKPQASSEAQRLERDLNKVSLVTLWVEPNEYQIIRYTFDDVDFNFLPGRWLLRVDKVTASMSMARVLDGVWLPRDMVFQGGFTLATGAYRFEYARQFHDHKKAETAARIRTDRDK